MAGSAYPHIIFAKNEETLPKADLEALLTDLLAAHQPPPATESGVIDVTCTLGSYTFTFWYDDEAEGLGSRYADYAPAIRQRRISKATTMIDFSGEADPDGHHAEDAAAIANALAELPDVYVFSEKTKQFVGMDYTDPFAAPPAPTAEPVAEPTVEPIEETEPVASHPEAAPEPVAAEPETVVEPEPEVVEPQPVAAPEPVAELPVVPEPLDEPEPVVVEPEPVVVEPEPVVPEPVVVGPQPMPETAPETSAQDPDPLAVEPEPVPVQPEPVAEEPAVVVPPTTEQPAAETQVEPVGRQPAEEAAPEQPVEKKEEEKKPGFLRRLFGRR